AVHASASPTANDSQQPMLPYNDFAANGNNPLNSVSQLKGALHFPAPPLASVSLIRFNHSRRTQNPGTIVDFQRLAYLILPAPDYNSSCRRCAKTTPQ